MAHEVMLTMSAFLSLAAVFSFVCAGQRAMNRPVRVKLLPRR